jgi:hypothetical protein
MPQLLTAQDEENYGPELLDMSKRAALEALSPELNALRQENRQLRGMATRVQYAEIERSLNQQIPNWRQVYQNPEFSSWLSQPDEYSGTTRSQLMRNAVSNGDSARVIAFYRGFQQEAGSHVPAGQRSRQPATGGPRIYTRPQIANLYERRRKGEFTDAQWFPIEADVVKAAGEGRVVGAVGPDGTEMSRWAR